MQEWHRAIISPSGNSDERKTVEFLGEPGDNPKLADIARAIAMGQHGYRDGFVWSISRAPDLGEAPELKPNIRPNMATTMFDARLELNQLEERVAKLENLMNKIMLEAFKQVKTDLNL